MFGSYYSLEPHRLEASNMLADARQPASGPERRALAIDLLCGAMCTNSIGRVRGLIAQGLDVGLDVKSGELRPQLPYAEPHFGLNHWPN